MQASRPALSHLFAAALVLGVAGLIFFQTRSYGLLGMDSYPIILTSRVQSLADLWGNFSERLMDGYYPAAFYRPLLNLSFAFDYALWGLSAPGYQLTNVLCFAACAFSLYAFLHSRPVPRPLFCTLAGVAFFLFHPLQFEVLPYPPRRPELMCATFMLLALTTEARSGWRFRALGGAATLLALASKETAVVLPALVFLRALVYPTSHDGGRGRWREAALRSAYSTVAVILYLVARVAALGGLGGRGPITMDRALEVFPQNLGTVLRTVTSPSSIDSWKLAGVWLLLTLPLLIAAVWRRGSADGRRGVADLAFSVGWVGLLAAIYTLSGRLSPWYVVVAIPAFSMALAGICEGYGTWLSQRRAAFSIAGGVGLICVALLVLFSQLRWSPVFRSYPLWQRATVVDNQVLERFNQILEQAEAGSVTRLVAERKKIKGKDPIFRGVVLQAHYSLQAWAALFHPDREVRVLKHRGKLKAAPVQPSEVVVILDRKPKSKKAPVGRSVGPAAPVPPKGTKRNGGVAGEAGGGAG